MRLLTLRQCQVRHRARGTVRSGWLGSMVLLSFSLLLVGGCMEEEEGSLYNPNTTFGPPPVLTTISPSDSAQAGADTVTINGSNFSSVAANNIVFFNATPGTVVQTSATQIAARSPLVISDSVAIRVAARGSDKMSNIIVYKLTAAVEGFGLLGQADLANAVTTDASGEIYVSISVSGAGKGIKRISADGVVHDYARDTTGVVGWNGLKFGPGGYLYGVQGGVRAVYRFAPGGGAPAPLWVAFPPGFAMNDLDFDQNQNLWVAGVNTDSVGLSRIYRVTQTPSSSFFAFGASVQSVRVFDNYLYLSALKDSKWGVWRAPIVAGSLGTLELYFDFDAEFGDQGYIPRGITFAASGNLYIATDTPAGFVVVTPAKEVIVPYADYAEMFGDGMRFLAWGSGTEMFAVSAEGVLMKVKARAAGAPYFR